MILTFWVARKSKFRGKFMTNKTDLFPGALTIQKHDKRTALYVPVQKNYFHRQTTYISNYISNRFSDLKRNFAEEKL